MTAPRTLPLEDGSDRVGFRETRHFEVWRLDAVKSAPTLEAIEAAHALLPPDEKTRARLIANSDAMRGAAWRATRIALRLLLERAGATAVRGVPFEKFSNGKFKLPASTIEFSLSHSGPIALIAVCDGIRVGVDFEQPRTVRLQGQRRELIMAAGLQLAPDDRLPADQAAAFLACWVRLEAFAKVHGLGIGMVLAALREFSKEGPPQNAARVALARLNGEAAATVRALAADGGLAAAVALAGSRSFVPPQIRDFPACSEEITALFFGE